MVSMAHANWREELGEFRIGIVGGSNPAEQLAKMEPFRLALEEQLGLPVSFAPEPGLRALIRNHADGRNEYAILSASAYAAAWASCECVEPLVVARSDDGSTGIQSVIISRRNNGVSKPADLADKTIMALNENATIGFAYPVHLLRQQNIDLLKPPAKVIFPETGEIGQRRFAEGEGAALIGWKPANTVQPQEAVRGTFSQLQTLYPDMAASFDIIWTSPAVPHRVHSIRKNIDGEPKRILRSFMTRIFEDDPVAYDAIEPDFGGGFEVARQSEFSSLVEFVKNLAPLGELGPEKNAEGSVAQ